MGNLVGIPHSCAPASSPPTSPLCPSGRLLHLPLLVPLPPLRQFPPVQFVQHLYHLPLEPVVLPLPSSQGFGRSFPSSGEHYRIFAPLSPPDPPLHPIEPLPRPPVRACRTGIIKFPFDHVQPDSIIQFGTIQCLLAIRTENGLILLHLYVYGCSPTKCAIALCAGALVHRCVSALSPPPKVERFTGEGRANPANSHFLYVYSMSIRPTQPPLTRVFPHGKVIV